MNIANTFLPNPQDHLTFFITVYIMLLLQLNLLLTNVFFTPCWSMPVLFGILILPKTLNLYRKELPTGLPTAGGSLHYTIGAGPLMTAFKS